MIGCLGTRVRKQPIIALYFESENKLKYDNLEARTQVSDPGLQGSIVFLSRYTNLDLLFCLGWHTCVCCFVQGGEFLCAFFQSWKICM